MGANRVSHFSMPEEYFDCLVGGTLGKVYLSCLEEHRYLSQQGTSKSEFIPKSAEYRNGLLEKRLSLCIPVELHQ